MDNTQVKGVGKGLVFFLVSDFSPRRRLYELEAEGHGFGGGLTVHVMHVILCSMKNLTLRIEEKTLETARRIAAERSTSVNSLVRGFLGDLARTQDRRLEVRKELIKLSRESEARIGNRIWNRDELHER